MTHRVQSRFMQRKLMQLRAQAPDVYDKLMAEQREMLTGARRALSDLSREKLVELTWDTVGSFLPATASRFGPTGPMRQRIREIASFVTGGDSAPAPRCSILDVGCGDGSIVPFLRTEGAKDENYLGIDLSGTMIQTASQAYPRATFEQIR